MILRAQGEHFSFTAWQLRLHREHSVSYVLRLIISYILKDPVLFPSFKTRGLKRKRDVRHCMVSQVSQMNESRAWGGGIRLFHRESRRGREQCSMIKYPKTQGTETPALLLYTQAFRFAYMTAPGCRLVLECTLGPNPLSTSFIFLEQVWTSDWNKFFLILSHLGYYYNQKSNVRKTWNYLRLSWDVRKRKKYQSWSGKYDSLQTTFLTSHLCSYLLSILSDEFLNCVYFFKSTNPWLNS